VRLKRNPEEFSASFLLSDSEKAQQDILALLGEHSKELIFDKQILVDFYSRKRIALKHALGKSNIDDDMESVGIAAARIQECDLFIQKLETLSSDENE